MLQISTQLTSHHTEGLIITSLQVVALMGKTKKVSVPVASLQTGLVGVTRSSEEKSIKLGLCSKDSNTSSNPSHLTRQDWEIQLVHHGQGLGVSTSVPLQAETLLNQSCMLTRRKTV